MIKTTLLTKIKLFSRHIVLTTNQSAVPHKLTIGPTG